MKNFKAFPQILLGLCVFVSVYVQMSPHRHDSHLDVFDSTAHQAVLLKRIPADIKDLQDRTSVRTNTQQHANTHAQRVGGLPRTLSEWPVAEARIFPLLHSQMQTVFLASRPTDASRCRERNDFHRLDQIC